MGIVGYTCELLNSSRTQPTLTSSHSGCPPSPSSGIGSEKRILCHGNSGIMSPSSDFPNHINITQHPPWGDLEGGRLFSSTLVPTLNVSVCGNAFLIVFFSLYAKIFDCTLR